MTNAQTTEATTWIVPLAAGKIHLAHRNRFGWALECSGRTIDMALPMGAPDERDDVCKRCAAK